MLSIGRNRVIDSVASSSEKRKARRSWELSNDQRGDVPPDALLLKNVDVELQPDLLLLCAKSFLAEGIFMILVNLPKKHSVSLCEGPFNYEEQRFNQLFEFEPSLSKAYSLFKQSCTTKSTSDSISEIEGCFIRVQKIATNLNKKVPEDRDMLSQVEQLAKVASRNLMAFKILHKSSTHDPSLKFSIDFGYHPHYAVASLKREVGNL